MFSAWSFAPNTRTTSFGCCAYRKSPESLCIETWKWKIEFDKILCTITKSCLVRWTSARTACTQSRIRRICTVISRLRWDQQAQLLFKKTESKHAARYNEFYSDLWPLGEHINYRATNTSYPRWYPAYVCARCTETHTKSSNYSKDTNTWVVVALVILICFGAHRPTEPYVSSTPVAYGGCGTWIVIILQIIKAEVHDGHSVYNSSQLAYTD